MNSKNDPESIESIIEQLSTNGKECLDVVYVKKLKSFCKNLNESKQIETYNYIGKLIFHQLKSNHAQIRYGSLLIIEYLFERSHQYRVFLENQQKRIQLNKFIDESKEIESDVQLLVVQINTCFELLIPKFKVVEEENTDSDEQFKFRPMQGLSFNIILNSKIEIVRDSTNSDLINNLEELCQELQNLNDKKMFPFMERLSSMEMNLIELFGEEIRNLKEKMNFLKIKIGTIVWKFNEIDIIEPKRSETTKSDTESDDDDFEDVPERENLILLNKIRMENSNLSEPQPSTSKQTSETIIYDDQCKALLPSGRLCPRRDRIKCPFHGAIIPRANDGLPIDPKQREIELKIQFQVESERWKDPKYLKQLSIETGIDLEGKSLKNKRKKYPNLIDLKKLNDTPRKRLMKKIYSKRMREKVATDLNQLDERAHLQYSQQWSYAMNE
ncbi:hypothetical protein RDWZM_002658 [Blomia tropicalis]|uniref:UV-stimulated scaffold protein A C-terminal domain-containing protein n=1 Tax=Blomia tropicalis TaxID=40697 RepID=A0A9Q0MFD9_BLOTA|nr:hypothetical protein RDWZM_002658 [Blomia tropicalis]